MLADQIKTVPHVYDEAASQRLREALSPILAGAPSSVKALIAGVGGASPYLSRLMLHPQADLDRLINAPLEETLEDACMIAKTAGDAPESGDQMRRLRIAKIRAALALALAEICGAWSTMEAAEALSTFADAALTGALRGALRSLTAKGFTPHDVEAPERGSGVAILAMGKHGAFELNYSSDIDIIVLYDPQADAFGGNAREIAVAATKQVVKLLQEQTADGYVFRTDLRLRPDPGVSAAAISVGAAETYYEAHGQNWERAAFIKARAAVGDVALGEAFLKNLRPFVWRKYLDFAAIEDIHSIKRQIHAAKGGGAIEFLGHDLKTGRGGIREIEFLVQTQQLILGGKNPDLRSRSTLDALSGLCAYQQISEEERGSLAQAYRYLRKVEHRIQMVNDEQTHKVPTSREGVLRLAAFLGEEPGAFEAQLRNVMERTHEHFADLFHQEERLSSSTGSLSFTGVENNPATLETLSAMGFRRPEIVSDRVRHWHAGGVRATSSQRAREILTKLTPRLLESLGAASDPDAAFVAFDAFLGRLPSGVQVFSLFAHSPAIFDRLIRIMTVAPFLGKELARRRHLIEALLDPSWPQPPSSRAAYREGLQAQLANAENFEDRLNVSRRWAREEKFQITAPLVLGRVAPDAAAHAYSDLADTVLTAMSPVARAEMRAAHGDIDGELAIIGLGRLGAGDMTATSDIDLIFVYDAAEEAVSDGAKPLDATTYFTRLVRRIVTALTAVTEEGSLYEVDMQLRPSGGAGPAAVSRSAFTRYFAQDAWTWEVMALTKARIIDAGPEFAAALAREIDHIISQPRDAGALANDVHEMRLRLLSAKPAVNVWDVKNVAGGVTDIDFIHQYLQLSYGARFARDAMPSDAANALGRDALTTLRAASGLYQSTLQLSRAATGAVFEPEGAGLALIKRMSEACGVNSLEAAESLLTRTERDVKHIYDSLIGPLVKAKG
ncbi:MAG: bifunctional [glutamine synthetase] adenylyltransferase/[glutamine synthetase]-adenylyl-L-tyrosine phosphorylase [Pseudomonadota bacterium]